MICWGRTEVKLDEIDARLEHSDDRSFIALYLCIAIFVTHRYPYMFCLYMALIMYMSVLLKLFHSICYSHVNETCHNEEYLRQE
jgi:hypothetical protein